MENELSDKERLEKLERLTENLPSINPIKYEGKGYSELDTNSGFGFFFPLFNNPEVAVIRGILSKGATFNAHYHKEKEWVIVFKGKLKVIYIDGCDNKIEKIKTVGTGDYFCIEPNTIHQAEALEDTETIAITIPASPGFPKE